MSARLCRRRILRVESLLICIALLIEQGLLVRAVAIALGVAGLSELFLHRWIARHGARGVVRHVLPQLLLLLAFLQAVARLLLLRHLMELLRGRRDGPRRRERHDAGKRSAELAMANQAGQGKTCNGHVGAR